MMVVVTIFSLSEGQSVFVRGFMREMVARTKEKVYASREAAVFLHSPAVLDHSEDFAGVRKELIPQFLDILAKKKIDASLAQELDSSINAFLKEEDGKRFVAAPAPEQAEDEQSKKKDKILRERALECLPTESQTARQLS